MITGGGERRRASPCRRRSAVSDDFDGEDGVQDESSSRSSSVTVTDRVDRRVDRPTSSDAAFRTPPGTNVTGPCHPRAALSTTSSGTALSVKDFISPEVDIHRKFPDVVDSNYPSSTSRSSGDHPTATRPGRLTNVEILERVFPLQRKPVLDLVLTGCNGDLVKAIEQLVLLQDSYSAQRAHLYQLFQQQQNHLHQRYQHLGGRRRSAMPDRLPLGIGGLPVGGAASQHGFVDSQLPTLNQTHANSAFAPPKLGAFSLPASSFITSGLPPPRVLSFHTPPALNDGSPSPITRCTRLVSPLAVNPLFIGRQPNLYQVPSATGTGLRPSLAGLQMMAAAAAATASRASDGTCPLVTITSGDQRASMTSPRHRDEGMSQALDLQCRSDVSTPR